MNVKYRSALQTFAVFALQIMWAVTLAAQQEIITSQKVLTWEKNVFADKIDTSNGKRAIWVQAKQMVLPGDDAVTGFPENQDIVYELWESELGGQAVQPLWKLTTDRPGGPTWRGLGAKVIYVRESDSYYLFLCHVADASKFYIFKVARGKSTEMKVPTMRNSPCFWARCRLPIKAWTFIKEGDSFVVTLDYFDTGAKTERYSIPVSGIP